MLVISIIRRLVQVNADRDDARRRTYTLPPLGTEVARAETARLASLVKTKPARALLKES